MKKVLLLLLLSLVLFACSDDDNSTSPSYTTYDSFEDIDIPSSFNYETQEELTLEVWAPVKSTVLVKDQAGTVLNTFMTDDTGNIVKKISIPSTVETLTFAYRNQEFVYPVTTSDENMLVELYNISDEEKTSRNQAKKVKLYVVPILEGVTINGDGSMTSYWGYDNQFPDTQTVPIGAKNKFTGSGLNNSSQDQGQPTDFLTGRHYNVFQVTHSSLGNDCITWSLQTSSRLTQDACPDAPLMPGVDSDEDGVIDDDDDYPNDETKAYDIFYPSENSYGTLAYEDLWPNLGDFDFNDLVLRYRIKEVHSAESEVKEVEFNFVLVAIGANQQNGFFIELPFNGTDVAITNTYNSANTQVLVYDELAVLQVFNNTNDVVQYETDFMNTIEEEAEIAPVEFSLTIEVNGQYNVDNLVYSAPYNPFLTVNHDLTKEVHLPGFPPTSNADVTIFGTGDDATNVNDGYYYKTEDGIPWAMNIIVPVKHPLERKEIVEAYPEFGSWVASGGTSFQDWYLNPVDEKVYTLEMDQ